MPPHASSSTEQVVDIDPQLIYFTFSRIRPRFSCGRAIESTLQQFRSGELQPRDLPLLSVLTDGTQYFSQNNRRLYTYKQLRQEGLLSVVPVRLRPFPQTKRMQNKYTAETCSLTATLMRDVGRAGETVASDGAARKVKSGNTSTEREGEDADEEEASEHDDAEVEAKNTAKDAEKQKGASPSPLDSSSASASLPKQPQQQSKKLRQKEKKAQRQQQRGNAKSRGSDDDDDGDGDGSSNTLEAELRRLGLQ